MVISVKCYRCKSFFYFFSKTGLAHDRQWKKAFYQVFSFRQGLLLLNALKFCAKLHERRVSNQSPKRKRRISLFTPSRLGGYGSDRNGMRDATKFYLNEKINQFGNQYLQDVHK